MGETSDAVIFAGPEIDKTKVFISPILVQEKPILNEDFRPIEKSECFSGGMPILVGDDKAKFDEQAETLYGGEGEAHGKWGRVLFSGNKATKIFYQPSNLLNAFDLEFTRRYGGVAGLPKFEGVVPNGYQMERFKGESLGKLINTEFDKDYYGKRFTAKEKIQRVISKEQAQELLDRIAEFHKGTGRVHGDLGHLDDFTIDSEGKIRLTDPEWERIGNETPAGELKGIYDYLTENAGYDGLILPETIRDEDARNNLEQFMEEVINKVEMDLVIGSKVTKYKEQGIEVRVNEGEIQIKEIKQ